MDSNHAHLDLQSNALPDELEIRKYKKIIRVKFNVQNYKFCVIPFNDLRMERETGLEPAITMKLLFYYVL